MCGVCVCVCVLPDSSEKKCLVERPANQNVGPLKNYTKCFLPPDSALQAGSIVGGNSATVLSALGQSFWRSAVAAVEDKILRCVK